MNSWPEKIKAQSFSENTPLSSRKAQKHQLYRRWPFGGVQIFTEIDQNRRKQRWKVVDKGHGEQTGEKNQENGERMNSNCIRL